MPDLERRVSVLGRDVLALRVRVVTVDEDARNIPT
jgi:hypothetical protein